MDEAHKQKYEFFVPRKRLWNHVKSIVGKKQVKSNMLVDLDTWLNKLATRVINDMNAEPYMYLDKNILQRALSPYEKVDSIEKEKIRIIKQLEAIKSACEVLEQEVDEKFVGPGGE